MHPVLIIIGFNYGSNQILLNPTSTNAYGVYNVTSTGIVSLVNASDAINIRPVVYLSSTITISGGTGTSSDPYTLSI